MYLLACTVLAEDLRLRAKISDNLLDPSEDNALEADANDKRESLDSISSCSGIVSESLLDVSLDHKLVTLDRESMLRCPMISYLLEEVEYEDRLVTEARLSGPISTEVSRENVEYLEGVRLAVVKEDISLTASGSGDGDWDLGDGVFGGGGGGGLLKPRNMDHSRYNNVSIICCGAFKELGHRVLPIDCTRSRTHAAVLLPPSSLSASPSVVHNRRYAHRQQKTTTDGDQTTSRWKSHVSDVRCRRVVAAAMTVVVPSRPAQKCVCLSLSPTFILARGPTTAAVPERAEEPRVYTSHSGDYKGKTHRTAILKARAAHSTRP